MIGITDPTFTAPGILLALAADEYPTPSLVDAVELARRLGAELEILRVMPQRSSRRPFTVEATAVLKERRKVHRATQSWLAAELDERLAVRCVVVEGELVEQAALRSRRRGVQLIVVSANLQRSAELVTSLARAAKLPVLVSRGLDPQKTVLAATDLSVEELPVVRQGARLAEHLGTSLVTFHNVDPVVVQRTAMAVPDLVVTEAQPLPAARREWLEREAESLSVPSNAIVRKQASSTEAILNEADTLDVGVIVIGIHYRSWWDRVLHGSIAAEIIGRSERPVLVTPIHV